MSRQKKPQMVEAVLFFEEHGIGKEMLYPEFEAVLDNIVQMPEYVDRQMSLVYVLIDTRMKVRSAVFFYLDFDENGVADRGWNLPLRQLAERAGRGPDMGAGPIRLACKSQCPVPWHQMHLWDPSLTPGNNQLVMIREAIKRNHLGLLMEEEPVAVAPERLQMVAEDQWYAAPVEDAREAAQKLAQELLQEHEQKTTELLNQHELRISTLSQQHERELSQQRMTAEEQIRVLQAELSALRLGLQREEEINSGLRQELDEHVSGFQRGRAELTEQLRNIEQQGREEVDALRAAFDVETQARMASAAAHYKEQIAIRDVELSYRSELEQQVRLENSALREEVSRLTEQVSDASNLQQLAAMGVIFVVYHPGAGQLTLSLQDIPRYRENPLAYAASKCSVSETQYRDWLAHYQQPACDGCLSNGERCSMPVSRVDSPARFIKGDHNCCSRHKSAERLRNANG